VAELPQVKACVALISPRAYRTGISSNSGKRVPEKSRQGPEFRFLFPMPNVYLTLGVRNLGFLTIRGLSGDLSASGIS
jgi:hypothetical protein